MGNVLLSQKTHAQAWKLALKLGNIKSDKATSVKTDDSGYVYVAGYFSNQINIGTNNLLLNFTSNAVSKEIYVAKLDSTGYCYWARSGGQYFDDRILGMDVDSAGNIIITGTFWEGAGINMNGVNVTGNAFGSGDQCFIYKLDRNGNVLWGNFVCSEWGDDQGLDVATDKNGNSYVVGFMTGTTLYCGGATVTTTNQNTGAMNGGHMQSYWLAKINKNGVFQWAKNFGSLPWDASHWKYIERDIAVCVDEKDGVYVTGGYDFTQKFGNTTLTTKGGYDIFAMKYDTSGNFKWVTGGGSRKDDWSNGITSDENGYVYITGEYRDSLIVDTILVKNYDARDAFVIKLDANTGKPIWGKRAGSNMGSERGNDIYADKNCNIYVCGDIQSGAKFGDNITIPSGKSVESFVARISTEGKWQWAATGGGIDSNDRANAICKGKNGQIYTCGFFRSPATYGTYGPLVSTGKSDGFIARLYDSLYNSKTPFSLTKPIDTVICKGDSVLLLLPPTTYFSYTPLTNVVYTPVAKTIVFKPTTTTTYTLTGIGTAACSETDTLVFTIVIAPNPVADFVISPSPATILNPIFSLNNTSTGATSYQWIYNGSTISNSTSASYTVPAVLGTYCFTLVATSNEGCIDTNIHCADVIELKDIFIPNCFSPNGDGKNDNFLLVYNKIDPKDVKDFYFVVYNRWGEEVYKSTNPSLNWNGKNADGSDIELGVYYYYCKYTMPDGKKIAEKNDLLILK